MKIDASVVYHYLYGYQPMRLASQEDINSFQCPEKDAPKIDPSGDVKTQGEIKVQRKIRAPDGIALCISSIPEAKYGACALRDIPAGTWFGPYEGKLVRRNEAVEGKLSEFMWEIFHDGEVSHFLDGLSLHTWMPYVQCARHKKEQNMVVFQYHGCIYYRTIREIAPGSELLVWYDTKYTQVLGLPVAWNDSKALNAKRKVTANNANEIVRKKRLVERSEESSSSPRERCTEKVQCSVTRPSSKSSSDNRLDVVYSHKDKINIDRTSMHISQCTIKSDPSTVSGHRKSAHPHSVQRHHSDMHFPPATRGLHGSPAATRPYLDKSRHYYENWHHMQASENQTTPYLPHLDKSFDLYQSEHKQSYEKHFHPQLPITMTSQVHDLQNYYHYNAIKHEDMCRFREAKPSFRPIA
ncbi:PR domain-containing protein 11-like [Rhopilema esculentum]|uniref:PR domain-containing protein 11-like n=1 Tax=Rhopilema esculentum TaxID=499914 RepID=UPI0031CFEC97|eukprot:gene1232-15602_t